MERVYNDTHLERRRRHGVHAGRNSRDFLLPLVFHKFTDHQESEATVVDTERERSKHTDHSSLVTESTQAPRHYLLWVGCGVGGEEGWKAH